MKNIDVLECKRLLTEIKSDMQDLSAFAIKYNRKRLYGACNCLYESIFIFSLLYENEISNQVEKINNNDFEV